jgi:hypothetical protein
MTFLSISFFRKMVLAFVRKESKRKFSTGWRRVFFMNASGFPFSNLEGLDQKSFFVRISNVAARIVRYGFSVILFSSAAINLK